MRKFLSILYSIALFLTLFAFGAYTLFDLQGAGGSDGSEFAFIIGVAFLILSVFPLISIFIKFSVFSRRRPILAILTFLHDAYYTLLVINTALLEIPTEYMIGAAVIAVLGVISVINVLSTLARD